MGSSRSAPWDSDFYIVDPSASDTVAMMMIVADEPDASGSA
jgi:hypothetical protein